MVDVITALHVLRQMMEWCVALARQELTGMVPHVQSFAGMDCVPKKLVKIVSPVRQTVVFMLVMFVEMENVVHMSHVTPVWKIVGLA
jgi:hypothetical protein